MQLPLSPLREREREIEREREKERERERERERKRERGRDIREKIGTPSSLECCIAGRGLRSNFISVHHR